MPCYDGRDEADGRLARAALCGIFRALSPRGILHITLDAVDWEKAGVTREQVLAWWAEHRRGDAS